MTLDWFVLLAPLLVLPIVALFVFVGCTLPTQGTWQDVPFWFKYDAGCDTGVQTIEVRFQPIESGEAPSNLKQVITLNHNDIKPEGDILTQYGLFPLSAEGDVECVCVITMMQTLEKFTTETASVHKVSDEDVPGWFELWVDGAGFHLNHS